jgi:alpha-amylase
MSRKTQTRKQPAVRTIKAKSLTTVPFEKGFHFYSSVGNYTGITATSLSEFAMKLKIVPTESIAFHFHRNDFQNWIKYTINDAALAQRIGNAKPEQNAEDLRREILQIIEAAH